MKLCQWAKDKESVYTEVEFDYRVFSERWSEETLSVKNDTKGSAMDGCVKEFQRGREEPQ